MWVRLTFRLYRSDCYFCSLSPGRVMPSSLSLFFPLRSRRTWRLTRASPWRSRVRWWVFFRFASPIWSRCRSSWFAFPLIYFLTWCLSLFFPQKTFFVTSNLIALILHLFTTKHWVTLFFTKEANSRLFPHFITPVNENRSLPESCPL